MDDSMRDMASVLILNNRDEILLIYNIKSGLRIGPPGGKVEQGETPEQCGVREIREELGIGVILKHFLGKYKTETPEGDFLAHTYIARVSESVPVLKEPYKIGHYEWFNISEIRTMAERTGRVNPNLVLALDDIDRYLAKS